MMNKNFLNNFRVVIASLPDRENCVCEIYYNHIQWAEISRENEETIIQFYNNPHQKYWEFPIDIALEILQNAKKKFLGE
jgi:hypothetical protein